MKTETDTFDLDSVDSADTAEMTVVSNGALTTWVWTFAGPGHEATIAQSDRLTRERLHEERQIEQARANGKKYKAREETPDDVRKRNATIVVERLLGWSDVQLKGEPYPFSRENAMKLLLDPKKQSLLVQALEFLAEDSSFTKRSATS